MPELTPRQKKANQRLGWILGAIAIAIFVGFIAKSAYFGM
ncbi:MAG: cytochrome oxidase small assembly protein [Pseudomonadota bacterium]|nr:cytochrome oxidase small assembly protein [Pseudomonadota bacterium]